MTKVLRAEQTQRAAKEPGLRGPEYGITRALPKDSFEDAVGRVKDALGAQGFGILSEIDVRATLLKKTQVDLGRPYLILGACAPALAYRALSAEPYIGLFLPCNVVITADDGGQIIVSALRPSSMVALIDDEEVKAVARDAEAKLSEAIASL